MNPRLVGVVVENLKILGRESFHEASRRRSYRHADIHAVHVNSYRIAGTRRFLRGDLTSNAEAAEQKRMEFSFSIHKKGPATIYRETLLVAQRFNGVEFGGFHCRPHAENQPYADAHSDAGRGSP
jgi:hypothetical protein